MTTPWRTARRPRVTAPREPVVLARVGRRVVRRRAKGMDASVVAAALEDARFQARQDSRHEDLADDVRGRAELTEWERLAQLLAAASAGTVYDPDTDHVVQAEIAADREAELREAMRMADRAEELQAVRELDALEQTDPRDGDEAARDELTRRAGGYAQADVDALAFAAPLATTEPEAARALADFLARAHPGTADPGHNRPCPVTTNPDRLPPKLSGSRS
ncbi:hypothetical protein RBH85_35850 (plasmid) [Streptomyces rochei]|nr:hypothetical protein [Streptomyces rochei]WMI61849.1 hypothetical protein RBH85_35850 [Streptomyces rochei]